MWVLAILVGFLLVRVRLYLSQRQYQQLQLAISEQTQVLHEVNGELAQANSDLLRSSQTDPLTGLLNRRYFETDDGRHSLADLIPEQGLFVLIDIDFFKQVNDTHGHASGDRVLNQFAKVLRSVTRQSDLVARWGGEEFTLICEPPEAAVAPMLERINQAIRAFSFELADGRRLSITASIGSVRYPLVGHDDLDDQFELLLELADAALYAVKENGRDGWACVETSAAGVSRLTAGHVGSQVPALVQQQALVWGASREDISPALLQPEQSDQRSAERVVASRTSTKV